jgi:hypothetical protein
MNIVAGKLLEREQSKGSLESLRDMVLKTLSKEPLDIVRVVDACDALSKMLNEFEHLPVMMRLGLDEKKAVEQLAEVKWMLSRAYLMNKLKTELGEGHPRLYAPQNYTGEVREEIRPLGVLLHIAAGNAQGLPVFSVIEGLLAGNINILKLPGMDDGVSVRLLRELIRIEPLLAEYIYVFDYPSEDIESIRKMAEAADAVVVWGSDQTVRAVRQLAGENMKIIEWGHKISFAYITRLGMEDTHELKNLAHNICDTDQLLCNSCQGIFLDTDDMEEVYSFCGRFLQILNHVSALYPQSYDIGLRAQITLQLRSMEIEAVLGGNRIFRGNGCSLAALSGEGTQESMLFRNCWVKRLPRERILEVLAQDKNRLQTLCLVCSAGERKELSELFSRTGVVRIARAENMSRNYAGAPHDGEYALRKYTKIITFE